MNDLDTILPRIRWRLEIPGEEYESGGGLPDGYGVAHRAEGRDVYVCYPIPINIIVAWVGALRWHLTFPPGRFEGYKVRRTQELAWEKGARAAVEGFWRRRRPTNPYRTRR